MIELNQFMMSFEVPLKYDHEVQGSSTKTIYLKPYKYFKLNSILKLDKELELFFKRKVTVGMQDAYITLTINLADNDRQYPKLKLSEEEINSDMLSLHLGQDEQGDDVAIDLSTAPHIIIAGTTGSGKSVCLRNIINQIEHYDNVKHYFLDGKTNELDEIDDVLNKMLYRMEYIYDTFTEYDEEHGYLRGTYDIDRYNKENPNQQIEKRIIIIDEFSDVIMQDNLLKKAKFEIEKKIIRLCQKARAAGIHIILATQRPDAKTLNGLIRANCPTRIALKCTTGLESRIVLDEKRS